MVMGGLIERNHQGVDAGERGITLFRRRYSQLDGDPQVVIAQKSGAPEKLGAGCEFLDLPGLGLGDVSVTAIAAAEESEEAMWLDVRDFGQLPFEVRRRAQAAEAQRVRGLEHE